MKCQLVVCEEHGSCTDDIGRPCIHLINGNAHSEICKECSKFECEFECDETFQDYQI